MLDIRSRKIIDSLSEKQIKSSNPRCSSETQRGLKHFFFFLTLNHRTFILCHFTSHNQEKDSHTFYLSLQNTLHIIITVLFHKPLKTSSQILSIIQNKIITLIQHSLCVRHLSLLSFLLLLPTTIFGSYSHYLYLYARKMMFREVS